APVVIIDANDLGVSVLGKSKGLTAEFAGAVFRDNPLGQSGEQTPMAIVRKSKAQNSKSETDAQRRHPEAKPKELGFLHFVQDDFRSVSNFEILI
ncbi:hypothetical protein HYW67_03465, partial [Candidatus Parcubacteria bacterium]|nr:hypothetical protein [Candidatus Parcubacteria bacterium]